MLQSNPITMPIATIYFFIANTMLHVHDVKFLSIIVTAVADNE